MCLIQPTRVRQAGLFCCEHRGMQNLDAPLEFDGEAPDDWATLFAYAAFHLIIIMLLAYIPYVIASVPIDALLHSTADFTLTRDGSSFHMKAFVAENAVTLKSFLSSTPGTGSCSIQQDTDSV
jgi:hypothetical protein